MNAPQSMQIQRSRPGGICIGSLTAVPGTAPVAA